MGNENILLKRENESELDYHKRIVYGKLVDNTLKDMDYTELSKYAYDKEYSSDVARRMFYGSRNTLQLLDKININNIEDNDIVKEIEEKTLELKKERVKVQTEKSELNKLIREQARNEMYIEKMTDAINNIEPMKVVDIKYNEITNNSEGLICIGDQHFGKLISINDLKGNIINEYNEEIFKQRMWDLMTHIVKTVKKEKINKLNVFNLSDCIDGILRISQLQSLQYGIVDSVIKFSDFMATWLNELSKHVPIEYFQCWGNHDEIRVLTGKKGDFPNENVNKLIMHYIEMRLKDNKNIVIHNDDKPFILKKIQGINVFGYHGEDKNLANTLKNFQVMYGENIDLMVAGHLHSSSLQTVGATEYGNIKCIRVPSICGADDFSIKLGHNAKAGATMFVFEEGNKNNITYEFCLN